MIRIEQVSKSYDGKVKAVDDISLEIKGGEIFGFIGPNGAGKSTTIKMMTGILEPDAGSIYVNGANVEKEEIKAKMSFGYVPDDPNAFLRLKGIEYVNFMADMYGVAKEDRIERIQGMAERFELTDALNSRIQSYSHGMRQKIVIMGALIHKPPVWILDEPMTGLDPKSSFLLKEMMKEHVKGGNTVFFSTHVLEVAERLCHRIAIIDKGKIIFCGSLEELKEKKMGEGSLEELFLELTGDNK